MLADRLLFCSKPPILSAKTILEKPLLYFLSSNTLIGSIQPASTIREAELVQLICGFRLFAPEVEFSLSTRESPFFRDNIIPLVINNLSAGSKTQPGGYADNHQAYDNHSAETIAKVIINAGLQTVWKDWDNHLGR